YYDMSDCVLFASLSEACSIAGIEAMSRNMPIISTNCEGLAEMFGDAALYAKMGADYSIDPDEYAAHMCSIIENKRLRNKLSVMAYSRYLARYTAKKMCNETLALYKKLVA
ncbi:MAG: glycosyltransferase family 4 protein, partial [Alphaproteobacteria bacterium]|nr:glycosyltransferase family 4 protein [Alphaproteobacteria bacterium]